MSMISTNGVEKCPKNLMVGKSLGPDNLPNSVLKEVATELESIVQAIFTQCLHTSKIHEDWRNANISPVFQKGNMHLAENHRPVSLTSVCCKLMEHICRHIVQHIESHSLLTPLQHCFHSQFSYET